MSTVTHDELAAEKVAADIHLIYDDVVDDFRQRLGRNPMEEGPDPKPTQRQQRQARKKAKRRSATILRQLSNGTQQPEQNQGQAATE